MITDAISGSGAKRDVGVWMAPAHVLCREAFRIEHFRIGEKFGIAVQHVSQHQNRRAGWKFVPV